MIAGGRPPIGSVAASVESVRPEPELRQALAHRAQHDHETASAVIRRALRVPEGRLMLSGQLDHGCGSMSGDDADGR